MGSAKRIVDRIMTCRIVTLWQHTGPWACGLALAGCLAVAGCDNAGQGALTGAAIGAGSGAAISAIAGGDAGQGAAIGAIVGAVGGAVVGDQNDRNSRY